MERDPEATESEGLEPLRIYDDPRYRLEPLPQASIGASEVRFLWRVTGAAGDENGHIGMACAVAPRVLLTAGHNVVGKEPLTVRPALATASAQQVVSNPLSVVATGFARKSPTDYAFLLLPDSAATSDVCPLPAVADTPPLAETRLLRRLAAWQRSVGPALPQMGLLLHRHSTETGDSGAPLFGRAGEVELTLGVHVGVVAVGESDANAAVPAHREMLDALDRALDQLG